MNKSTRARDDDDDERNKSRGVERYLRWSVRAVMTVGRVGAGANVLVTETCDSSGYFCSHETSFTACFAW